VIAFDHRYNDGWQLRPVDLVVWRTVHADADGDGDVMMIMI
jgi:hypothetical protein